MKRKFCLSVFILIISVCALVLTACNPELPQVKKFTVTVVGGTGGGVFEENALCTVSANVASDREFVEWQADGASVSMDAEYSFKVTRDVTLTAVTEAKATPDPVFDLGAFARKWVGKDGTLDLTQPSWSYAESFTVTGVSGQGANTVIDCIADDVKCKMCLTDEGKLKIADAELFDSVYYTYMPTAEIFNGVWKLSEGREYALFVTELNEDGFFGWAPMYDDGSIDEDFFVTAETKLVFDGKGSASVQFVNAFGITYEFTAGSVVAADEGLTYVPTADFIADCYISDGGNVCSIRNGGIIFEEYSARLTLKSGIYGAGLYFWDGASHYALVQTLDGVCLFSADGRERLRPFSFVGDYTNGCESLTVDVNLSVKVGNNVYSDGRVVTLGDLDRVDAIAPSGYAGIQNVAISFDNASKYLIWIPNGVAIATGGEGSYVIQSAYFTQSQLTSLQQKFTAGLISLTDKYTTGGSDRLEVGLDFENGNVVFNGSEIAYQWGYAIRSTGDEYVTLNFNATADDVECACVLYPLFGYDYMRLQLNPVGDSQQTVNYDLSSLQMFTRLLGTEYHYLQDGNLNKIEFEQDGTLVITNSKQELVERYTRYDLSRDPVTDVLVVTFDEIRPPAKFEVSIFCEDIGVWVSMVQVPYVNPSFTDVIGVYTDADGTPCMEIFSDLRCALNAKGLNGYELKKPYDSIVIEDAAITYVCSNGTIVFTDGKATLTTADGKTVVYAKQSAQPPEQEGVMPDKFIGTYIDADGKEFVRVLADNMVMYDTYGLDDSTAAVKFDSVTIDGGKVTCTAAYSEGFVTWTVTFVFEGDSVTVDENDGEPVTYTKQ